MATVKQFQAAFRKAANRTPMMDSIVVCVADHFNVTVADLMGTKAHRDYVLPRQFALMFLYYADMKLTYGDIASFWRKNDSGYMANAISAGVDASKGYNGPIEQKQSQKALVSVAKEVEKQRSESVVTQNVFLSLIDFVVALKKEDIVGLKSFPLVPLSAYLMHKVTGLSAAQIVQTTKPYFSADILQQGIDHTVERLKTVSLSQASLIDQIVEALCGEIDLIQDSLMTAGHDIDLSALDVA